MRLYTSDLVVSEALVRIGRARGKLKAAEIGRDLFASRALTILRAERATIEEALHLLEIYVDQPRLNFVDCVSFALMSERRIDTAFTFDRRDFAPAGFSVLP